MNWSLTTYPFFYLSKEKLTLIITEAERYRKGATLSHLTIGKTKDFAYYIGKSWLQLGQFHKYSKS